MCSFSAKWIACRSFRRTWRDLTTDAHLQEALTCAQGCASGGGRYGWMDWRYAMRTRRWPRTTSSPTEPPPPIAPKRSPQMGISRLPWAGTTVRPSMEAAISAAGKGPRRGLPHRDTRCRSAQRIAVLRVSSRLGSAVAEPSPMPPREVSTPEPLPQDHPTAYAASSLHGLLLSVHRSPTGGTPLESSCRIGASASSLL